MGVLWSHSNTIERDSNDVAAPGALAFFYVGGTTTPLTVYEDAAEASPHDGGHEVEADGNGRWPNVFVPFSTSYDVRVTTSDGAQLYYPTQIPNLDPVEASEDSVDDTQLLQTGDIVANLIAGTRTGFIRLNGLTFGSATSGGTERANADTEDLFTYLWNNLANGQAAVSTGRGASAAADWAANKTITLPNGRAAGLLGLDDMGNSAAGLLPIAGVFIHGNATTAGSLVGENTHTMTEAEVRAHTHTFSATTSAEGSHTHTGSGTTDSGGTHTHTGTTDNESSHTHTGTTSSENAHTHTGTTANHFHQSDFPNFEVINVTAGAVPVKSYNNTSTTNSTSNTQATFTTDAPTSHNHTFTSSAGSAHSHTFTTASGGAHTHTISFTTDLVGTHSHSVSGTSGSTGSSTAFNTVHRSLLVTWFVKL